MGNIKQNTIKGVKWTAIEKLSFQGIQFIIGIILARLLSPSDFGVVGMMTIFISISQTIVDGGFSNALIRKKECSEEDYSTAFYFNIVIGIFCYGILFTCAPIIASFFNTPILSELLKIFALSLFINSLSVVQLAKLSRNIDFRSQAISTILGVLLSGAIGIYLAYTGYGVWALVWQQVSNAAIKTILIWIQARWTPHCIFSLHSFRSLFGYGSKILLSNLIGTLYMQLSTIAIGKFYTSKDLGFYTRGQQFAHFPSNGTTEILGKVTFPILAQIQNNDDRLIHVYRKYIQITSFIIIFMLMMLASIAKPLVLMLLTNKWAESIIFLQIFCFAYMFEHICKLNLNLLQVKGRSDLYLRLEIIKKIIAICILIISIPLGVLAICISKIIYGQFALAINTYYTGKNFNLGYFQQVRDFGPYVLLSALACCPAYIITFTSLSSPAQLALGCTSAIALYCLFNIKNPIFIELIKEIKKRIKRN